MNDIHNHEYYEREKREFDECLASLSGGVTPSEAITVEEIINEELDNLYHERIAISQGVCPVCYTELSEDTHFLDDDLTELVYYCPHCGYESDPRYD